MAKASNVSQLNQHVDVNLDELERESKPAFAFVLAGERVEMKDPAEIDIKDLMQIDHPAMFLKFALSQEAKDLIDREGVPGWKFNDLLEKYMAHYGLDPAAGKGWLSS